MRVGCRTPAFTQAAADQRNSHETEKMRSSKAFVSPSFRAAIMTAVIGQRASARTALFFFLFVQREYNLKKKKRNRHVLYIQYMDR